DDIKTILPLLQEKEITDLTITNQELEDKFMTLYEGGEIK
ncbi:TPA: ABC transporter ATP-binding protein, partial [Listeria monocytogenes]